METHILTDSALHLFRAALIRREKTPATIDKYMHDIREFAVWTKGKAVTPERAAAWKHILAENREPATVNCKIAALNALFSFLGWEDCRVKALKIQRKIFREDAKELTRDEFIRLVSAAERRGKARLALLLEAIGSTGVRVSEIRYLTVEAAKRGIAEIALKGKIRTILLPGILCRKLLKYARKQKIASGGIFLTRSGKPISRKQVWAEMKAISKHAGISPEKVFPHNLRHLFARAFYRQTRDVVRLADLLGHSSLATTTAVTRCVRLN